MLADPFPVKRLSLGAATAITVLDTLSFARVIDPSKADGSSKYSIDNAGLSGLLAGTTVQPLTLRIGHLVSKENKPAGTRRTQIRLDLPIEAIDGSVLNAYISTVIGVPLASKIESGDDNNPLSNSLVGLALVQTMMGILGVSSTASTLSSANITRILAGES